MTAEPVDQLAVALDATERVILAVRDDQWDAPSPCTDWKVHDVVNHLVAGNNAFARILRGDPPAPASLPPASGPEFVSAYRASGAALLGAFREPGVLQQVVTVPIGAVPGIVALHLRVTEALVHGWDVARAIGHPAPFPDDLAEQELAFSRAKLGDLPPGRSPFAPPQPVAADAPAIDRLVALLGRSVAQAAPTG
ncbi:MAG TPA: TIGR03086 family metal-binding protein [Chloroflexota bacterium]|nr:TIGR03086 family metal-binding protein [Chloroflexota bacterium]